MAITSKPSKPSLARKPSLRYQANLGLATTRELLRELEVRGEITQMKYFEFGDQLQKSANNLLSTLPNLILDYRTVDG